MIPGLRAGAGKEDKEGTLAPALRLGRRRRSSRGEVVRSYHPNFGGRATTASPLSAEETFVGFFAGKGRKASRRPREDLHLSKNGVGLPFTRPGYLEPKGDSSRHLARALDDEGGEGKFVDGNSRHARRDERDTSGKKTDEDRPAFRKFAPRRAPLEAGRRHSVGPGERKADSFGEKRSSAPPVHSARWGRLFSRRDDATTDGREGRRRRRWLAPTPASVDADRQSGVGGLLYSRRAKKASSLRARRS